MFSSDKKKSCRSWFQKLRRKRPNLAYKIVALLLITIHVLLFKHIMILEGQPENANAITAIYWATTTIATVGYGDVVFTSLLGRVFSIVVQITGILLISGFLATYVITP
jgi:voltage-gated potassium channel